VTDAEGRLPPSVDGRRSLTSREILRDADGRFAIVVSATARPGNRLPSHPSGRLRLTLRLYDTPLALSPETGPAMPRIERGACR